MTSVGLDARGRRGDRDKGSRRRAAIRSVVVGVDGSAASRRAVAFVGRLGPPPGRRATVVRVVEPSRAPGLAMLPASIRARLRGEAAALQAERVRAARRDVDRAVAELEKHGWRVRGEVIEDVPIEGLLRALRTARADLLALGARGIGQVGGLFLGSVADSAIRRAPVPVLLVP